MKAILQMNLALFVCVVTFVTNCTAQHPVQNDRDKRVQKFLEDSRHKWHNLNVPYEDGQLLYNLIVENNYQSALEIGTSTGHSTIWIAWALSKTGGQLTTLEMDSQRQQEAIENLKKVGLADVVHFKLGDAHQLVKELPGPFDFVFSDADKDWYIQYFKDLDPKLKAKGCFTAHNVLQNLSGIAAYMDFVTNRPDYETIVDSTSSSGLAISRKK